MKNRSASQIALAAVVVVVGASFFWWFRERPAYLLYKAHKGVGQLEQSAAIAEYRRLLRSPSLTREDEMKHRLELGTLYLRALEESNGLSRYVLSDPNQPGHPFIEDAKKEFDRVLALDPENAQAHLHLGQILWIRNMESYAIEELELGRKKDPTNPAAFRYLSSIYLERGDSVKAKDLALQALAILPSYDEARMTLIEAYSQLGDTTNALKEYDFLSPGYKDVPHVRARHALYLAEQNYWDASNGEIGMAMAAAPNSGPIKIIYGQLLVERGQYDAAIGAFSQAQDLLPRNVWPMIWKSHAMMLRGDCAEAERVGQMLTSAWPRWAWGRLVQGWAYLCQSDDKRAVGEINEAFRLTPDLVEALRLRARLFLDRGQFEALGQAIRPMLDQKILEAEAHVFLAYSLLEQGKVSLASEMAETAIRINQRSDEAITALAEVRARAGDATGAARAFENARELNPYDAALAARRFRFWARSGQMNVAESGFKELALNAPHSPVVWLCWGDVQLMRGDLAVALLSYQNALSKAPHLFRAHLGLVEAYSRQGNGHLASVSFMRASEMNPRHPELVALRKRMGA